MPSPGDVNSHVSLSYGLELLAVFNGLFPGLSYEHTSVGERNFIILVDYLKIISTL